MTSPPYSPTPADVQRVLLLSHTGLISGAERALLDLVCHLPPTVQAMVLAPEGPLSTSLRERGIRSLEVQGTAASLRLHPTHTPRGVMELVSSALELRTAAFRTRSHVVHANSLRAGIIAVIARAMGGPRVITHIHDALPHDHVAHAVAALLARGSSALIAVSQFARARFLEAAGGDYPVTVLPNPVDLDRFTGPSRDRPALRRELGLPPTAPVVAVIGQITPWKGQHTAIAALATLRASAPDARLLIVGETKFVSPSTRYDNLRYERELRALISHFALEDAVEFWGEREDIPSILCALDALLVPSDGEPLGRSVLEAMASGTPVIATAAGGPAEIIQDGVTGYLVESRSSDAWADIVQRLLDDPLERVSIGVTARQHVQREFTMQSYVRSITELYGDVGARPRRWS